MMSGSGAESTLIGSGFDSCSLVIVVVGVTVGCLAVEWSTSSSSEELLLLLSSTNSKPTITIRTHWTGWNFDWETKKGCLCLVEKVLIGNYCDLKCGGLHELHSLLLSESSLSRERESIRETRESTSILRSKININKISPKSSSSQLSSSITMVSLGSPMKSVHGGCEARKTAKTGPD